MRDSFGQTATWSSGTRWAAQTAPGLPRLGGPQGADRHDLEDPDLAGVGDGQHLAAVVVAVAVLLGQGAHQPDGLAGRPAALHGQQGEHGDVRRRRRRGIAELADVADRRLGDGQLLVVHVAEDGVVIAVGVRDLGDLDPGGVLEDHGPFAALGGRPGPDLVDVVELALLGRLVVGGRDMTPGEIADAAIRGVRAHDRTVGRGLASDHDDGAGFGRRVGIGSVGRGGGTVETHSSRADEHGGDGQSG